MVLRCDSKPQAWLHGYQGPLTVNLAKAGQAVLEVYVSKGESPPFER